MFTMKYYVFKGDLKNMNGVRLQKFIKSISAVILAFMIAVGSLPLSQVYAAGSDTNSSDIKKIDNIALDYSEYYNSSVVFELPDTVKDLSLIHI